MGSVVDHLPKNILFHLHRKRFLCFPRPQAIDKHWRLARVVKRGFDEVHEITNKELGTKNKTNGI